MKVLLIAPFFDENTPGESWCTFKWVQGISEVCDATVLTCHVKGWSAPKNLPSSLRIVNWTVPSFRWLPAKLRFELKPYYPFFYAKTKRWIRENAQSFDLIHQINPVSLRYPSPAVGSGIPYILGPHAGSLPDPEGWTNQGTDRALYRKLRNIDSFRVRHDPMLRRSFEGAGAILGVAPYVREFLDSVVLKRFEILAETGPKDICEPRSNFSINGTPLKLLFAGRLIRTKGIYDALKALEYIPDVELSFDVYGDGELLADCREMAAKSSSCHKVTIHGRVTRDVVMKAMLESDAFLFPSFREPSGTVVFEALGSGLPLIVADRGGPGYVIDNSCGFKVTMAPPVDFQKNIATAIKSLMENRSNLSTLSAGCIRRVKAVASWEARRDKLISIYTDVITNEK